MLVNQTHQDIQIDSTDKLGQIDFHYMPVTCGDIHLRQLHRFLSAPVWTKSETKVAEGWFEHWNQHLYQSQLDNPVHRRVEP